MKTILNLFVAIVLALSLHTAAFAAERLNINTASASQLADQMNGVGTVKAEAIISYRDEHGKFESVDQLVNVKGIGLATIEKNREALTVSAVASKTTSE